MRYFVILIAVMWCDCLPLIAQESAEQKTGAVSFSGIVPDARSGGMGETGIATKADVFSLWHNGAKVVFMEEKTGAALGYTPWMTHLSGDMKLVSAAFYHRFDQRQAITGGIRYFSVGKIELTDESGTTLGDVRPGEFALDLGYSRLLARNFSAALTFHYIHSDLGKGLESYKPGNTVTFDLGLFYARPLSWLEGRAVWNWGVQFANAGGKISYGEDSFSLPCKLGIGTGVILPFSDRHELNGGLDIKRRMLPASGFEFKDLLCSAGLEYWYVQTLALRAGYLYASETAGNNKFFTVGAGVRWNQLAADVSYAVSGDDTNALKNTLRLSLGMNF